MLTLHFPPYTKATAASKFYLLLWLLMPTLLKTLGCWTSFKCFSRSMGSLIPWHLPHSFSKVQCTLNALLSKKMCIAVLSSPSFFPTTNYTIAMSVYFVPGTWYTEKPYLKPSFLLDKETKIKIIPYFCFSSPWGCPRSSPWGCPSPKRPLTSTLQNPQIPPPPLHLYSHPLGPRLCPAQLSYKTLNTHCVNHTWDPREVLCF